MDNLHYNGFSHDHSPAYSNGMPSSSAAPQIDGSTDNERNAEGPATSLNDASFDILEWHPAYQSCQRYFLDHAQHESATQAVCALVNIRLPFQWIDHPVTSAVPPPPSSGPGTGNSTFNFTAGPRATTGLSSPNRSRGNSSQPAPCFISPIPYIRRLVVTGFDNPAILHGFFGDDYNRGIMPHVECERRNFLFAAKHGGWRSCKKQYDTGSGGGLDETVPFMKPLDGAKLEELAAAEKAWSKWLCMEDWMVGPRAPEGDEGDNYRSEQRDGGPRPNRHELPDGI